MSINICPEKQCILCGRCLEVCPLFKTGNREELSPRSKGLFLQELQNTKKTPRKAKRLAGMCLSCGRCKGVCPQGLDIPDMVSAIKESTPTWQKTIWKEINRGFPLFLPFMARANAPSRFPEQVRPYIRALKRSRPEPLFSTCPDNALQDETLVLFPGCLTKNAWPWLASIAKELLENRGARVLADPGWSCCGYSLYSAGLRRKQKNYLGENTRIWEKLGRHRIVTFCATCYEGLKQEFGQHLVHLPQLLDGLKTRSEKAQLPPAAWHVPCHAPHPQPYVLNALGDKKTDWSEITDSCCGLGGSMLLEDQDTSHKVAAMLWDKPQIKKREVLVTGCSGCVLQLEATKPAGKKIYHWLELFSG